MTCPCEECPVLAICRSKYRGRNAIIHCEILWTYVVSETEQRKEEKSWLRSVSYRIRTKRIEEVKKVFKNYDSMTWNGDTL